MPVQNDNQALWPQDEAHDEAHAFVDHGSDFVLVEEGKPPSRIELARERMLISRLYLGLLQTIDTTTPAGKAMFQMMGVFAEFERAMIAERVRAGLRRARSEGKQLGRPRIAPELEQRILTALKTGETIRGAAEKFNVNPSTVQRLKHPFDAVAAPA